VADSVSFDRAAEYYDATRAIDPDTLSTTIGILAAELGDRGRILEVGVGTGVLALPLSDAGVPLVGVDLSRPMLGKLLEKAGGRSPFPLIQADATRLPIGTAVLGGAYLRWVLHLIPDWCTALAEIVRAVRPGGVVVIEPGGYTGAWHEVWNLFVKAAGPTAAPVGLDMHGDLDELDPAMEALGATPRRLPELRVPDDQTIADWLANIEQRRYSWTWSVGDEEVARGIEAIRAWASAGHVDLDQPVELDHRQVWRAYDVG
jgi:SAM-dependent methyltransferase